MGLIKIINHGEVKGARFGKYNIADNSSSIIYSLGDTIIDSGPPNQARNVIDYLKNKSFDKLILTHHHEDHSGNADKINKKFNTPVFAHEFGRDILKKGFKIRMYQKIFWGSSNKVEAKKLPDEIDAGKGFTLRPIHTPGHSRDHVCFFEEENKWLFTGDLFIAPRPKLLRADEDLFLQINSLEKILNYDFETVFCSHCGIIENGYEMIKNKLYYFYELIKKVEEYSLKGYGLSEISNMVLGKKDMIGMISFKHLSKINLVNQCLKQKSAS